MAKTRPKSSSKTKSKTKKVKDILNKPSASLSSNPHSSAAAPSIKDLLSCAQSHLAAAEPSKALPLAQKAHQLGPTNLSAIELLATTHLDLSNPSAAYELYSSALTLSPSTASYHLWSAQLHPSGGGASISHYETAISLLRTQSPDSTELVSALCSCAEIYMSDLCMEEDAEARCERYVNEALLHAPTSCEANTTLASVRISQQRMEDAVSAVRRAKEAVVEGEVSYALRVQFVRVAIEVGELESALEVTEGCIEEDDSVVDLWYLGGWTLWLLGEEREAERLQCWKAAREWLNRCRVLFQQLEWEDEGIWDHSGELLEKIKEVLGEKMEDDDDDDGEDKNGEDVGEDEWESESDDEMAGS